MHRDVVTHVAVSAAEFFITGSADGKSCPDFRFCNCIMFFDLLNLVIVIIVFFASHVSTAE